MTIRYGSVCSGIEAASVAWEPLGWRPAWFAEIDRFPSAVLAHRFPGVTNHGDFTAIGGDAGPIDLLVGGTPCQSFSVAGLRKGLADDRGNLALGFLRLAGRLRPRWLAWENVPGVLSSNGGRDFGAFLGGLVEFGYGFAYRVLDAQYVRVDGFGRAVPQRRRRVFVVGHLGDWRRAVAVLFDRESVSWNPPPCREAGQGVADCLEASLGRRCGQPSCGSREGHLIASVPGDVVARPLAAHGQRIDFETETFVAHTLKDDGFDASEDGTGRGVPLVPVAFGWQNSESQGDSVSVGFSPTLDRSKVPAVAQVIAFPEAFSNQGIDDEVCGTLYGQPYAVATRWAVRRLTPRECERLMGLPDDWTLVPYRGKPAADGPRYKAVGNSFAVNVVRWLGRRIQMVEDATGSLK